MRVLVIDDDSFQLEFLPEVLKTLGLLDISVASSGEQALSSIAQSAPFDLILVDLYMPGMDGFQFMEALGKRGFKGSMILISGQSSSVLRSAELVAQLRRFNLLGALSKPADRAALEQLISKVA